MFKSNFLKKVESEVTSISNEYSINESKAFIAFFAKIAFDLTEEDIIDELIVDGSNDKGVDLIWVDDNQEKVIICQCEYSKKGTNPPKIAKLNGFTSSLHWLESPELLEADGKIELAEKAKEYKEAIRKGYNSELWFVYSCKNRDSLEKHINAFNTNSENQENRRYLVNCDVQYLEKLFDEFSGEIKRINQDKLNISSGYLEIQGGFGKGIVTTINASELIKLYKKHGTFLFARNVRLWLGAKKGSVNEGIIETIKNENEQKYFWAYNNGVTIICNDYIVENNTLEINEYSIVNGCQTTVALSINEDSISDNIYILLRVIRPPDKLINYIIRYTNTQNQIRLWDLRTQDLTQIRLQKDFKELKDPYYYQLRRGDLQTLTPTEKKKFKSNGKMRIIKNDLLTQYIASYQQDPYTAYKHKAFLFTDKYNDIFPPDIRVEKALFIWKVGNVVDEMRQSRQKEFEVENNNEALILKRGGRFYILGVFSYIAELRNGKNYLNTIDEIRITSNTAKERFEKYAKMSVTWYIQAVNEILDTSDKDISVLVRSQDFFEAVRKKVKFLYDTFSVNQDWLKEALPKLKCKSQVPSVQSVLSGPPV